MMCQSGLKGFGSHEKDGMPGHGAIFAIQPGVFGLAKTDYLRPRILIDDNIIGIEIQMIKALLMGIIHRGEQLFYPQ